MRKLLVSFPVGLWGALLTLQLFFQAFDDKNKRNFEFSASLCRPLLECNKNMWKDLIIQDFDSQFIARQVE